MNSGSHTSQSRRQQSYVIIMQDISGILLKVLTTCIASMSPNTQTVHFTFHQYGCQSDGSDMGYDYNFTVWQVFTSTTYHPMRINAQTTFYIPQLGCQSDCTCISHNWKSASYLSLILHGFLLLDAILSASQPVSVMGAFICPLSDIRISHDYDFTRLDTVLLNGGTPWGPTPEVYICEWVCVSVATPGHLHHLSSSQISHKTHTYMKKFMFFCNISSPK